jgi:hypothetical protein
LPGVKKLGSEPATDPEKKWKKSDQDAGNFRLDCWSLWAPQNSSKLQLVIGSCKYMKTSRCRCSTGFDKIRADWGPWEIIVPRGM